MNYPNGGSWVSVLASLVNDSKVWDVEQRIVEVALGLLENAHDH
jgi:hypothetical protein